MPVKYFCDRCGNEVKHPDRIEMRTDWDPKKSPTSMDAATFVYILCRDCTTAVRTFFDATE